MKTSVKTAIGIALIWIIITLIAFLAGYAAKFFAFGIMLNMFLLLVAITLGLYMTKKEKGFADAIFLDDFKTAMQGGLIYAIIVSGFIYFYHEVIDSSIKDNLVKTRIETLHTLIPNEAAFITEIRDKNPEWQNKSFDDYIENQEIFYRQIYSSFSVFIFHMMGLLLFAMFFSFFGTIIMRKIILRQ